MRGQLFSLDFLSAIFIFLLVFGVLITYWGSFLDDIPRLSERKSMELYANRIADFLVSGRGKPGNWEDNSANVATIGLTNMDRTIDEGKLNAFLGMDYDDVREKLMISGYNFCFKLVFSGIEKCDYGSVGGLTTYATRAVSYNGTNEILEIYVWRYV